jgi:hypothetical protein
MSTIEIKIPDELNNSILKLTNNKQSFILEAIGEKINRLQKKRLRNS